MYSPGDELNTFEWLEVVSAEVSPTNVIIFVIIKLVSYASVMTHKYMSIDCTASVYCW